MRILFLHDNFPAQFGGFGQFLSQQGWDVWFGTQREGVSASEFNVFSYKPHRAVEKKVHPYAASFERAVLSGQAVARACFALKKRGLSPDLIMAHSGWGPGLFVKDVWPTATYIGYFEWFYKSNSPDIEFLAGLNRSADDNLRVRTRNAPILMDLAHCDTGICPTNFQKAQFPQCFGDKLNVFHDGIATDYYTPSRNACLKIGDLDLSHVEKIITYVARGMEPYRGFPEFMQSLEVVLREEPEAHVVIVGDDRVVYGKQLPAGESYKKNALQECNLDWDRVHFTGLLPRHAYLSVLQASSVHVYLTVPFVLSWSMMEAMSAGCAIVASDVDSVKEVVSADRNEALLVDHTDQKQLASQILNLLRSPKQRATLSANARLKITSTYSAQEIYSHKLDWLMSLRGATTVPGVKSDQLDDAGPH